MWVVTTEAKGYEQGYVLSPLWILSWVSIEADEVTLLGATCLLASLLAVCLADLFARVCSRRLAAVCVSLVQVHDSAREQQFLIFHPKQIDPSILLATRPL